MDLDVLAYFGRGVDMCFVADHYGLFRGVKLVVMSLYRQSLIGSLATSAKILIKVDYGAGGCQVGSDLCGLCVEKIPLRSQYFEVSGRSVKK